MQTKKLRLTLVGLTASLSLVAAACGDDDDPTAATGDAVTETTEAEGTTETTEAEETETTTETTEADDETASGSGSGMAMGDGPVGPACSSVPAEGEGSFAGMADDPAATAASNNPELSTLVSAVTEADLVDTLNGEGPFTIFAPANSAFAAIPQADMDAVMADQQMLTDILTYHVVAGEKLDAAALSEMDSVETVNGGTLTLEKSGDQLMVNGTATVVCANVETSNAVVHIIDGVLMP